MTSIERVGSLHDVTLAIEVELDRKNITVKDLLALERGAVLKMTRSAGENIDIYAGGSLVAFGEIVLVEDMIAVRITDFNIEE